uniref:Uncharacterized protein n=1 Tax=Sphaerodactylus townsendi TaxID=933632 RepID=A0ACB8EPQ8_9SAUR
MCKPPNGYWLSETHFQPEGTCQTFANFYSLDGTLGTEEISHLLLPEAHLPHMLRNICFASGESQPMGETTWGTPVKMELCYIRVQWRIIANVVRSMLQTMAGHE